MKRILKSFSVLLVCVLCLSYLPRVSAATVMGDIDSDGKVSLSDARTALRFTAGIDSYTSSQLALADIDKDGSIELSDVRSILEMAIGVDAYYQGLLDAGFPVSYAEYLAELHEKYPKWEFVPMVTGLDWATSVAQERTPHSQQLIQNTAASDFLCSCSSCKGVIQEGSTWVSASEYAVEYYMDPRNFLNEQYIFQFESTLYDSAQTQAGVEAILKGTWMYNSAITYVDALGTKKTYEVDGASVKYSEAIMSAAKKSGMSAYYLASKIVQEVGATSASSSNSASGVYSPYKGIYNYYNIGATSGVASGLKWANGYMKTSASAVMYKTASTSGTKVVTVPSGTELYYIGASGDFYRVSATVSGTSYSGYVLKSKVSLSTTYGRPWTTPQRSISYGAQYIYETFIEKYQQYTGYLQKFNVNPDSGMLYDHEYMANVQAAAKEAYSSYKAYLSLGILQDKKIFVIPVFKNMPNQNLTREEAFKASSPSVSCSSYTSSSVTLSWQSVRDAEKYQVYKYNSSTAKYEKAATVSTLNYTDSSLSSGESKYKVRAYYVNDDGVTVYSEYSSVFVACAPPSTPSGLTVSAVSASSVKLKWTAVSCTKYAVYRYNTASGAYSLIGTSATNSYTDSTVKSGTSYKYKIRAYNSTSSKNFYSSYSSAVTASTTGASATQTGVVTISSGNLNIRETASTSADVVAQLQNGATVTVLSQSGDWYKVQFTLNGVKYTGYAHSDYIKITSTAAKETCPYTEPESTVKQGSSGEGVKWVQWYLYKLGYLSSESDVDGAFGSGTLAAVKSFQSDAGITVDGLVGSGTRTALKKAYEE